MRMTEYVLYAVFAILLVNILVSFKLLLREDLGRSRKTVQFLVIWLIPLLGGLGVWFYLRGHEAPIGPHAGRQGGADGFMRGGGGGSD